MSLNAVPVGTRCRVRAVRSDGPLPYRLMEMGLIEGADVQVVGRAPLGDPIHLRLADYELAVRSAEAGLVDVSTI